MKKFLLVLLLGLVLTTPVFAEKPDAKVLSLRTSSGVAISSLSLTSGVDVYSEVIDVTDNIGFATILVTENIAGGAGDVDVFAEYSMDGTNFYTAYSTDMAGNVTADGAIVNTVQNTSRWVYFSVRLAPYMRFRFNPDANSTLTAKFIFQRAR